MSMNNRAIIMVITIYIIGSQSRHFKIFNYIWNPVKYQTTINVNDYRKKK